MRMQRVPQMRQRRLRGAPNEPGRAASLSQDRLQWTREPFNDVDIEFGGLGWPVR